MAKMLAAKGVTVDEDLECDFTMEIPANAKEIIDNLKTLRGIKGISFESMVAKNPYIADFSGEIERLTKEMNEDNIDLNDVTDMQDEGELDGTE